jgi:flagellar hook-associated protein 2
MTRAKQAADALATVNGISVTSASNTLADVVDGLTITLMKEGPAAVDLTVENDTAAIRQKITDFVTAYNELAGYLQAQTAYDAATKTAGALQGDQGVNGLQRALRAVLNQESSASSTWSRLSQVGLTLGADGKMQIEASKLDNALANLPELKKLLATDGADNGSSGFMRRWKELGDAVLGVGGTFEARTAALKANLANNGKSQDRMEVRLAQTEARLRAQYTALDQRMAQLNNLSSYLAQQINGLNNLNRAISSKE